MVKWENVSDLFGSVRGIKEEGVGLGMEGLMNERERRRKWVKGKEIRNSVGRRGEDMRIMV